ncbi:Carboxylesterase type B [Segniliparus rotundus DSM 44985]|uniref:Carboxylesterase type B n=1 Tax=Segniliparus rotundus (strain ATCC BAA-972 / CDC 1076 / CIP 108378 / DSM 44985 / JCM 13578) TaxID=640132 RepID=D6ZA06_SEGRD|nr:Carboxylesterase type B [Segniliparus rotundus DSM 44985]
MRFLRLLFVVCLVGLLPSCSLSDTSRKIQAPLRVHVADGWYEGNASGQVRAFFGIRYAQAPTGVLRFASPMPMPAHEGVWGAAASSGPCPQLGTDGKPVSTDEDCLTVNVMTPRTLTAGQSLPVMVWFHGGGFTVGDGHQYDPRRLVEEGNVIVVTANFRLGLLAQLGLPGVADSGNFGLADQLSVLQWAHRNAAAFGGDPGNVTMFGESSGAMSICALLASPSAAGLAAKAILSSGSCATAWPAGASAGLAAPATRPFAPVSVAEQHGLALAKEMGCPQNQLLDCLRKLPAAALVEHSAEFGNLLAYGTRLLPQDPLKTLEDGAQAAVPIISGSNHDEGTAAVADASQRDPISAERYDELVRRAFGAQADQVLQQYPVERFPSPGDAWARISSDAGWLCPAMRADDLFARRAPVYSYEFDDLSAPNAVGAGRSGVALGAAHGTELPYLFDVGTLAGVRLSPSREAFAKRMIQYWTSFAWHGEPEGDVPWPRREPGANGPVLRLYPAGKQPPSSLSPWDEHKCAFWGTVAA